MKKSLRAAAVLAAVAFLITACMPIAALAEDDNTGQTSSPTYTISATSGGEPVGSNTNLTTVVLGAQIELTVTTTTSSGTETRDTTPSYAWTVQQLGSEPKSLDDKGATIKDTPQTTGTYTYSVIVTPADSSGGDGEGGSTDTDPTREQQPNASITINVTDDLQSAMSANPFAVSAGTKVTLKAQWPAGTATPSFIHYTWTPSEGAPPATQSTADPLTATVEIPGTITTPETYTYTLTAESSPSTVPLEKQIVITLLASNTLTGTIAPVTWYLGSKEPPKLTATFSSGSAAGGSLTSSKWQKGSSWSESGTDLTGSTISGMTSTLTVDTAELTAGTHQYVCHAVYNGAEQNAVGTLTVAQPPGPTLSGSAAVNNQIYATGAGECKLNAVAAGPPVLSVTASGGPGVTTGSGSTGTGGSSGTTATDLYKYAWYKTDNSYAVSGTAQSIGSNSSLQLNANNDLAAAGQTAYFVCVVTMTDNTVATATQKFAVTTLAQPDLGENSAATSENIGAIQPVDTELPNPLTLAVKWDPPVVPSDVLQYQWTVTSAPAGGQVTLKSSVGANPVVQGGYIVSTKTEPSIEVTNFSTAGTYIVSCVPQTSASGRDSYPAIDFKMVAGAPTLPTDLVPYYATQDAAGDIALSPATQVQNKTVAVNVNSRLALYIPKTSIEGAEEANAKNAFVTEWLVKRSPSESAESLPSGAGFYGVNDYTLVTGPVTTQMNGWQFCMQVSSASAPNDPALTTQSAWITLRVNGNAPSTTPQVTLTSTPAAQGGSVPVATGGNVTLTAMVTNTSSIPASNLSYQWYIQASTQGAIAQAIEGATSPTFTISNVTADLNGQAYWCVVSNSGHMNEQGTSSRLTLSVNSNPGAVVITEPTGPSLTNLSTGKPLTFVAEAHTTDGSAVTYQWYMRRSSMQIPTGSAVTTIAQAQQYLGSAVSSAVPEGKSSTLTVPSLDTGVYEYSCLVTNSGSSTQSLYSAPYYVAVTEQSTKPVITLPTQAITYVGGTAGEALYLECEAYLPTDDSPAYQWQAATSSLGPWSDLGSYTESALRIPSLSDQNNGAFYRCMVTNPSTNEEISSYPYQVSVWSPSDTPTITSNPQSVNYTISLDSSTQPADFSGTLESTATSSNTAALVAQWQYRAEGGDWENVPNAKYGNKISGPDTSNGTSRLRLASNPTTQAPSGQYRCIWMSGTQAPNQPLIPQSDSIPAVVEIILPGNPRITAQPTGAAIHVGSTASFSVGADLGQQGTIVYVWQTSSDRGKTWRNCTSATDGTGQFTATFQTYPVTEEMYETLAAASPGNLADSIYQYRCIVANRIKSLNVISEAVPLSILPGTGNTPTIAPGSNSEIQIVGSGGAKYTKGVKLTPSGTTASAFLKDLGFVAPAGYTLQMLDKNGQEVPSSAIVCTGMRLVLVQTVSEETVDTVNIVVMGDVLGEGKMSLSQLVSMARAFRGRENLSGAYYQAALLTGRDKIQLSDLVVEAALYREMSSAPAATSSPSAEPTPSASASAGASTEASASASASGAR